MTYRSNNATRIFTNFGNIYEQLDNMHISVPEYSYQYDNTLMSSVASCN